MTDFRTRDAKTIDTLVEYGGDLSRPFKVDHYIFHLDEANSHAAAEELRGQGYEATLLPPDDETPDWQIEATREMHVSEDSIAAVRAEMTELAHRHGGVYDGWGAVVNDPVRGREQAERLRRRN